MMPVTNRRLDTMNTTATADSIDEGSAHYSNSNQKRGACSGRGKWSKLELATMIGGFIVFWPAGLVALGAKLVKGEMWTGSKENIMPWTAYANWRETRGEKPFAFTPPNWNGPRWSQATSGNAAFDAYKREQINRLEAERRKLDDEQRAFAEHLTKLRHAKDKEEFDRFMAERAAPKAE
jgi:Protein of unknown function (DUF2852)